MQVQSLVGELRSHMPQGQKTKTYSRSNIVTNSIKTLKIVHIKKKIFKKKKKNRCPSDNSFGFPLSEKVFIAHLFLKCSLLNIEFMVDNSFLSAFEKFYITSYCTPWFQMRNLLSLKLAAFLWLLVEKKCGSDNTFNSVFSFWNFIYDVSWCQFIWIFPIWN